jgi:DNA-binding PadR family transcriptional regulator
MAGLVVWASMKVRDALLALLARGPAHGYRLKVDYERLTGAGPVNVGQIYPTLERLQRDGLVDREDANESQRRVSYSLTDKGRSAAHAWLLDPGALPTNGRSAVAGKVLMALGVPGVDAHQVIDAHRLAFLASIQSTRRRMRSGTLDLEERLAIEAEVAVTDAELRWLDLCEAELRNSGGRS